MACTINAAHDQMHRGSIAPREASSAPLGPAPPPGGTARGCTLPAVQPAPAPGCSHRHYLCGRHSCSGRQVYQPCHALSAVLGTSFVLLPADFALVRVLAQLRPSSDIRPAQSGQEVPRLRINDHKIHGFEREPLFLIFQPCVAHRS